MESPPPGDLSRGTGGDCLALARRVVGAVLLRASRSSDPELTHSFLIIDLRLVMQIGVVVEAGTDDGGTEQDEDASAEKRARPGHRLRLVGIAQMPRDGERRSHHHGARGPSEQMARWQ